MNDPLWLTRAKALPAGRSTRVTCCTQDKSMLVTNDKRGYRGHCFRCGTAPFVAHGLFSVEQLARRKAEQALLVERVIKLPDDFTTDVPAADAVWLYKAGVGNDLSKHYGFGYSPVLRRVILPVYINGALAGFTARSTVNERPKYIEKMARPTETIFVADPATHLPSSLDCIEGSGPGLVLTEDILSAVRVGRNVRRSVSLLGTSASAEQIGASLRGLERGRWIAVWLDPDGAGQFAAKRLIRSLTMRGLDARNIVSTKDPKRYSNREIREWLTKK